MFPQFLLVLGLLGNVGVDGATSRELKGITSSLYPTRTIWENESYSSFPRSQIDPFRQL